ncbi:MAG: hypothetical protein WBG70_04465 [Spirulinaceae cyanobacterium]
MTTFERNYLIIASVTLIIQFASLGIQMKQNHTSFPGEHQIQYQAPLTQTYKPSD